MRCWRAESAAGSCRNVWYAAHDDAGTVGDYVNDLQRARRIVATQVDADLAAGRAAARLGLELRYTLVGAAVTTLAANVPAALVARLVRAGRWTVARGLGHARRLRDPVERAVALARLTPLVAVGPDGPDLVPELRAAAAEVTDPYRRCWLLAELVELLPEMSPDVLATDALAAAGEIEDDDDRAEALTRLASMLPGPLLPEALDVALGIEDGQERARALAVREVRSGLPRTSCGRAGSSLRRGPRSCCRRSGHAACARRWRFAPPGESKPG